MKLDRSEILENIEDIQAKVDEIGYFGINEHELEVRERVADYIINNFVLFGVSITEGQSCKCGNKTFTHRHTNWIECTSCNRIKVLQD